MELPKKQVDELRKNDIGFKVLAGHGSQIDTTTSNGRFVFGLFAALAEFERSLIIKNVKWRK
jgi:DNA invertase Pin-like site-specific DNA recombinase